MILHRQLRQGALFPVGEQVPPERDQRGFTIIEVAVGVAMLILLLAGGAGLVALSITNERLVRGHQAASEAGSAQLDLVTSTPFDNVASTWDGFAFHVATETGNLVAAEDSFFARNEDDRGTPEDESEMAGHTEVVVDPDGTGTTGLLEVRITVAWQAADGASERVDYVTRMAAPSD